jgi:hypothetical protein
MGKRLCTGRILTLDLSTPPANALNQAVTNTNHSATGSRSTREDIWRG